MHHPSEQKIAQAAVILILLILTASCAAIFHNYYNQDSGDKIASVYQDGTLLYTFPLSQITDAQEITISGENGAYNLILVEPGSIMMKDASCPDHLCIHMGKITSSALPITCLPNKIVIQISDDNSQDIDSVSY